VLLLFNQLIGFVNGDIRSFFFARADCRTNPPLCDHLASRHRQRQGLKGKRPAITVKPQQVIDGTLPKEPAGSGD